MELSDQVVDIQLLDVVDYDFKTMVTYTQTFGDGTKQLLRRNVKHLGGFYEALLAKPVIEATCLGEVYLGILKNDVRYLFIIRLTNGTVQLIQVRSKSRECAKLLMISEGITEF